jgi:hypothetical protein
VGPLVVLQGPMRKCLCAVGFGTVGRRANGVPCPVFFLCPASVSGLLEGASNWAAHVNKAHC